MRLFKISTSRHHRRRIALGSCAALTIMAVPMLFSGSVAAGTPANSLTATVSIDTRDYDGGTSATISGCVLTGVIDPDDVSCDYSGATATFDSANVGSGINVSVSGLSLLGLDASNYQIDTIDASGTIEAVTLTVSPDDLGVAYGDAEPEYTFDVSGFVNGEDASSADGYFPPSCDSDYDLGDPVGDYTINCTGGSATNYVFDTSATGTLTVGNAVLTVSPSDVKITYGQPEPSFDADVTGFVNSENSITADGYSAPACDSNYQAGDPAGTYTITCSGGGAADYSFSYETATLTVIPFVLGGNDVEYSGQLVAYTKSASFTSAQVTLTASVTADLDGDEETSTCSLGGPSVADGSVTFVDEISGKVLASNVPIAEVGGNCEEGIATAFATLSTGLNGTEAYVIDVIVNGSFSGSNDAQVTNDLDTTMVMVSQPVTAGTFQNQGELPYKASTSSTELGTAGTLTTEMNSEPAVTSFRFIPGTRKVTPKGQAIIVIPAADGGFYYVKSNSITSVVTGTSLTTVFAKASITLVGGACEPSCAIEGNVSLRLDITSSGAVVGYTVQSSKTSALFYSNDWFKDGRVWKTRPQLVTSL